MKIQELFEDTDDGKVYTITITMAQAGNAPEKMDLSKLYAGDDEDVKKKIKPRRQPSHEQKVDAYVERIGRLMGLKGKVESYMGPDGGSPEITFSGQFDNMKRLLSWYATNNFREVDYYLKKMKEVK